MTYLTKEHNNHFNPQIFSAKKLTDKESYLELLNSGKVWRVFDTIKDQLVDLVKTRNPHQKKESFAESFINREIQRITSEAPLQDYGNWVYYPWSGSLVHILPEMEFNELRLNRNKYKLTEEEQKKLSQLCIGIVGLSVGNAIANTIALEGIYGNLKLADFDDLELSNMNRIRAGIFDIGIPKTTLAARQIYEQNPYANISIFNTGITEDNIDDFFKGTPKLDLVIEECDEIRMKILIREKARSLNLPVLMETSDRGMLDVERFDLEPKRKLFHGLLGNIKYSDIPANLSSEDKIKYALPIVGLETFTPKLGASFLEVEKTISTYPQLGSEVTLGGATICAAIRRLGLGKKLSSGRKFIDLDMILRDDQYNSVDTSNNEIPKEIEQQTEENNYKVKINNCPEFIEKIVSYGILAPSPGNCQPWKFIYDEPFLWVLHDMDRSETFSLFDSTHSGAYIAIGAAIKNMEIAAARFGLRVNLESFPLLEKPNIVARLSFEKTPNLQLNESKVLFPQLRHRVTNRKITTRIPLEKSKIQCLKSIAIQYNCELQVVTEEDILKKIAPILGEGDRIRFLCEELHQELMSELRWTKEEALKSGSGIDISTLELTANQEAGVKLLSRPDVARFLRKLNGGQRLNEISEEAIISSSGVGLICSKGDRSADKLTGGMGIEHMWLKATEMGLSLHPMTALIYMFEMLESEEGKIFNPVEKKILLDLRDRFNKIFPKNTGHFRLMFFRFGVATPPKIRSLRIPLNKVLFCGSPVKRNEESAVMEKQHFSL